MTQRKTPVLLATALLAVALALPASAAVEEGTNDFEIFAGVNFTDTPLDEAATFGISFGRVFTPHVGGEIALTYWEDDSSTLLVDADDIHLDLSVIYYANPDSRGVFKVYGGIGWTNENLDVKGGGSFDEDSFTAHAGIGGRFTVGESEKFFLSVDGKARWYENTSDDRIDFEALFGFGWVWGN